MKRFVIIICFLSIFVGCKEESLLKFCEGKSPDGVEINCGKVFSAGDLSIQITGKETFGIDKLTVNIFVEKKYKKEKVDSLTIDVKPDDSKAGTDIKLYEEGKYSVEIFGKDGLKIADGAVEIVDVY